QHEAVLILDEAHALGVFGEQGRGLAYAAGVTPDVLVGTLGKALGLSGAFVAGSTSLRRWLWNRARSFVFSTAVSPALAGAIPTRVEHVRDAEGARAHLGRLAHRLRARLTRDLPQPPSGRVAGLGHGPIVPLLVGGAGTAVAA